MLFKIKIITDFKPEEFGTTQHILFYSYLQEIHTNIILLLFIFDYEMRSLTLMKEHALRVPENGD
jgi:hypothetical protein